MYNVILECLELVAKPFSEKFISFYSESDNISGIFN